MQQSGSGTPIHLFSYPGLRSIVGTYSVVHPLFRHNPLFSSLLDEWRPFCLWKACCTCRT